jgi:ketosteroid isomerase-like protein
MDKTRDVTTAYWDAVSAMDADEVASGFSEHALFRFGNTPPRRGRASIRRSFVQLFAQTAHIGCRPIAAWRSDTCVVADVDLTIVFDDGRALTIPTTTTFRIAGQQIQECRIHFYPEPALEPPGSGIAWLRQ